MKILVTADFYTDFELYETEKMETVNDYIAFMLIRNDVPMFPESLKLIGSNDNMTTEEAIEQADEVIYISDMMEELGIDD